MRISELTGGLAEWQRAGGPMSDIVISSRVRLARNLAGMPFLTRCGPGQVAEIARVLAEALLRVDLGEASGRGDVKKPRPRPGPPTAKKPGPVGAEASGPTQIQRRVRLSPTGEGPYHVNVEALGPMERQLLVERHLISRQHAEGSGPRGVVIAGGESVAVMINEEDHLRMQVLRAGEQLSACYEQIRRLDERLEKQLSFAFSSRFGYLTACLTNVGTGLRLSVMLHLPGLKMTGEIEKVLRAASDMHLAVRGLYGEGTEAIGELFQVSNQTTLGKTEGEVVRRFKDQVLPGIIEYERRARAALLKSRRVALEDKVHRAAATLRAARLISSEETMYLLSHLRLGLSLGIATGIDPRVVEELSLLTRPAHLQIGAGREMSPAERGEARANLIRRKLEGS